MASILLRQKGPPYVLDTSISKYRSMVAAAFDDWRRLMIGKNPVRSIAVVLLGTVMAAWADSWNEGTSGSITSSEGTRVGIGIAIPTSTLHVNGTVAIGSALGVTGVSRLTQGASFGDWANAYQVSDFAWIYSTNNNGPEPFNESGNLIISARASANRDIVFQSRVSALPVQAGRVQGGTGILEWRYPVSLLSTVGISGVVTTSSRLNVGGAIDNSTYALNVAGGAIAVRGINPIQAYGIGSPGDANYERLSMVHTGSAAEIRSQASGTGVIEPLRFVVGTSTRYEMDNSGNHTITGTLTGGNAIFDVSDNINGALVVKQGGNDYIRLNTTNTSELLTIGNATTKPIVRILGGQHASAGLRLQDVETNATNKEGRLKAAHYNNAEEPVTMLFSSNTAAENKLFIGGNSSFENAVTNIDFFTAATNTSTAGIRRGGILSNGTLDWQGPVAFVGDQESQSIIRTTRANGSLAAFASKVTGDVDNRFRTSASGKVEWGPGSAATDVSLERGAASTLQLTGALAITSTLRTTGMQTADGGILLGAGAEMVHSANSGLIRSNTSAGADTKRLVLAGGGADGSSRGAGITMAGNNHANMPGYLDLVVGNVPSAKLRFSAGGAIRGSLSQVGDWSLNEVAITAAGRVGIGVVQPEAQLHVGGETILSNFQVGTTQAVLPGGYVGFKGLENLSTTDFALSQLSNGRTTLNAPAGQTVAFSVDGSVIMTVEEDKVNVLPGVGFEVEGTITAHTVKATGWEIAEMPDYVFEKGYKLASLEKVESFVKKNKHLPEVPSAGKMKEEGLDLVKMNFQLLKKVEELTLYAIEQNKRIAALEKAAADHGQDAGAKKK